MGAHWVPVAPAERLADAAGLTVLAGLVCVNAHPALGREFRVVSPEE
ncbi:hypothetical protein [Paractinoplanes abujensis]|uniref:Uncharacterized protein n=1 Tax=Paractinoplanes abujensis TaxID=882441 RepID=A0A7W7D0D6_9ACTN|nr:hypothetical protein [Actinoplanes abujensis]MBB4697876.1 hypothetical protein [Actinoplanes abujensis]